MKNTYCSVIDATIDEQRKRFLDHADASGGSEACWVWKKAKSGPMKYGSTWFCNKVFLAHRLAYALFVGPVPAEMCVCHKCDTPLCVNPNHLFLGTYADNNSDRTRKGRTVSPTGERSGKSKLTQAEVDEIRRCSAEPRVRLAERFGVSPSNIYSILTGLTWRR
jgi:hypothetical protein